MLRSPRRIAHSTGQIAIRARARALNATKPHELPRTASVSTRIRSAHVLAGFRRPLQRRTSLSVLLSTRRSTFIARHLASPHRRVSRHSQSTLPSTCTHHTCARVDSARGQNAESMLVHKKVALSTAFRSNSRNSQRDRAGTRVTRQHRARRCRRGPRNATKPRKFPYVASISTRIDLRVSSPTFIGQDGVELRIGVSFKCRSTCASRHRFCAGELLVARPSSLPST